MTIQKSLLIPAAILLAVSASCGRPSPGPAPKLSRPFTWEDLHDKNEKPRGWEILREHIPYKVPSLQLSQGEVNPFPLPPTRKFELSKTVSPCNDFFTYVCGEEIKSYEMPPTENNYYFTFSDADARLNNLKFSYLLSLSNKKQLTPAQKMLNDYYASCKNEQKRINEENATVEQLWAQLNGKPKDALLKILGGNIAIGDAAFTSAATSSNLDNPSIQDVILMPGGLKLRSKDFYSNEALLADYQALLMEFFKAVGHKSPEAAVANVIQFEKMLAEVSLSSAEKREIWTKRTYVTKTEALAQYKNLRLEEVLSKIPDSVLIRNPIDKAMAAVDSYLGNASAEQLQNLYVFKSLFNTIDLSNADFEKARRAFYAKYLGAPEAREPLLTQCAQDTFNTLSYRLDYEIVQKDFATFPTERVQALVERVKAKTQASVDANDWLSPAAKEKASLKIRKLSFQIVKPERLEDWDFEPLAKMSDNTFLANQTSLKRAQYEAMFAAITTPKSKTLWGMSPLTVNAYYSASDNKFVMPLGILQAPFFSAGASDIENLGAMGAVVAHEIGHSIDDSGSKFDENGSLAPWMSEQDLANFKAKTSQLVSQFTEAGVDGQLTLGENIADFVGVTNSFRTAVGANATQDEKKAFFIQYAKVWCSAERPESRANQIKFDPHSPTDLRVNEQVKLNSNFAEAFACHAGDKMTLSPEKQVQLW